MRRSWLGDVEKLIFAHIVLLGVPTIFYYCLRCGGFTLIDVHMVIATFFLFSSIVIIIETTTALFRRYAVLEKAPPPNRLEAIRRAVKRALGIAGRQRPWVSHPIPKCSFLVAAYLPNEQGIILETLQRLLLTVERPKAGFEVILAYNTPIDLPIEQDLRLLTQSHPELKLLRVDGSHSKAENLNAALELVTGEITCILDADHHPAPDCFRRAWVWLEQDYDVVQGRNIIRNHGHSLLTQNIAIEFESVYAVSHAAKSFLTDSSIFGGSNGYWRTDVLKKIRFNPAMLTEDIDASMRTLLSGFHIVHDRSILTTELAPVDFNAFWFQRKRWAHGWLEVSLKYQRRVWKSANLTLWQKVYWTYLLYYCVLFSLLALQVLPLIFSLYLYQGAMPSSDNAYLWFSTFVTFASGMYQTLVTLKLSAIRYPLLYFVQYATLIFFYTVLKNMITITGIYDHLHGNNKWVVTPRGERRSTPTPEPAFLPPNAAGLSSPEP